MMGVHATRIHVFDLTPTEEALLQLREDHPQLSAAELFRQLGMKTNGNMLRDALEKRRYKMIWDKQQKHTGELTTKAQGHGSINGTRRFVR